MPGKDEGGVRNGCVADGQDVFAFHPHEYEHHDQGGNKRPKDTENGLLVPGR